MKRRCETQEEAGGARKRRVEYSTFRKWQRDLDHEHQTMSWLECNTEKGVKKVVASLKCKACAEFVDKIRGRKNFSDRWIVGADSVRISNIRVHARNDQHTHAMTLLKKKRAQSAGLGPLSYAPIAQAFSKLSDEERERGYE